MTQSKANAAPAAIQGLCCLSVRLQGVNYTPKGIGTNLRRQGKSTNTIANSSLIKSTFTWRRCLAKCTPFAAQPSKLSFQPRSANNSFLQTGIKIFRKSYLGEMEVSNPSFLFLGRWFVRIERWPIYGWTRRWLGMVRWNCTFCDHGDWVFRFGKEDPQTCAALGGARKRTSIFYFRWTTDFSSSPLHSHWRLGLRIKLCPLRMSTFTGGPLPLPSRSSPEIRRTENVFQSQTWFIPLPAMLTF